MQAMCVRQPKEPGQAANELRHLLPAPSTHCTASQPASQRPRQKPGPQSQIKGPAAASPLPPPQGKEDKVKAYVDGGLFTISNTTFQPLAAHPFLPCEEDVAFVQSNLARFREMRSRAGVRRPAGEPGRALDPVGP
jgi:hypothetical protein